MEEGQTLAEILEREEHAERLKTYQELIARHTAEIAALKAESERVKLEHDTLDRDLQIDRQTVKDLQAEEARLNERLAARRVGRREPLIWVVLWAFSTWLHPPMSPFGLAYSVCIWSVGWSIRNDHSRVIPMAFLAYVGGGEILFCTNLLLAPLAKRLRMRWY